MRVRMLSLNGWILMLFVGSMGQAAVLEHPQPGSVQSGIGMLSGWKCEAGTITVRFDGGPPMPIPHGSPREDTRETCLTVNTGYALLWNWNLLGDGEHCVELFDDGVVFAQASFQVVSLHGEFLTGRRAATTVPNFPTPGETTVLAWQESSQRFTVQQVTPFHVTLYPQAGAPIQVSIELAETPAERRRGLMEREELPERHGMLFLFPQAALLSFWMRNTPLPLDILFINSEQTIVYIAERTTPYSLELLPSVEPAQFVLEVNAGFSQRHGVASGDQIELPADLPRLTR